MNKEDFFETTRTTTDAIQFNFYDRDKSKSLYKKITLLSILLTIMLFISFACLLIKPTFFSYMVQSFLIVMFISAVYFIPKIIVENKLKPRGNPYYEIGVDFDNSEIMIKTGSSGMHSYNHNKIEDLNIVEISSEAYMITFDKKNSFKVANEMISPLTGSLVKDISKIRDNRIIIKMIALMLLSKKRVNVLGPHWNLQNMLDIQKEDDNQEANLKDEYKESINLYKKNEKIGSGYYIFAIVCAVTSIILSFFFKAYILLFFSTIIIWYFIYKYLSNPGFTNKIEIIKKDSKLSEQLMSSIKNNNPDIAYILTVPSKVVYPHDKDIKKEMEKILIMSKGTSLFVRTASGRNIFE